MVVKRSGIMQYIRIFLIKGNFPEFRTILYKVAAKSPWS